MIKIHPLVSTMTQLAFSVNSRNAYADQRSIEWRHGLSGGGRRGKLLCGSGSTQPDAVGCQQDRIALRRPARSGLVSYIGTFAAPYIRRAGVLRALSARRA